MNFLNKRIPYLLEQKQKKHRLNISSIYSLQKPYAHILGQIRQKKVSAIYSHLISHSSGRSMIEMLGVLAIIAMLSIGGLYAYRQAMTKYYANHLVDVISRLQFGTIDSCQGTQLECERLFSNQKEAIQKMCDLGFLHPDECLISAVSTDKKMSAPSLQYRFWLQANTGMTWALDFFVVSSDVCAKIAEYKWDVSALSGFQARANYGQTASRILLDENEKSVLAKDC